MPLDQFVIVDDRDPNSPSLLMHCGHDGIDVAAFENHWSVGWSTDLTLSEVMKRTRDLVVPSDGLAIIWDEDDKHNRTLPAKEAVVELRNSDTIFARVSCEFGDFEWSPLMHLTPEFSSSISIAGSYEVISREFVADWLRRTASAGVVENVDEITELLFGWRYEALDSPRYDLSHTTTIRAVPGESASTVLGVIPPGQLGRVLGERGLDDGRE